MAIKKDTDKVTEKNGMRVTDNMNGEVMAKEKLGMEVADLSSRLNTKEINELIRRSRSGDDMNKLLKGKGLTLKEIKQLEKIILKRN
tara:strand:+ start:267 stop:527 length:261 start_codon:yes stop_codon:yes gene_type:complete